MLKEVYGNECLARSRTQVFECFKRFKEGRETTEDDPRPGRPSTSVTDENIEKIGKLIRNDRRLSIRGLAEITGIDKECLPQILHESFNIRKVCEKMMPKLLTPEQKESRMNNYADILNIDTDPGLLYMFLHFQLILNEIGGTFLGGVNPKAFFFVINDLQKAKTKIVCSYVTLCDLVTPSLESICSKTHETVLYRLHHRHLKP
ncbi:hypothetical protein NQ318_022505 [Aromia moschata]|uniref:Mos1 transposase HTH domain-containing protein n=1 Tax=Aromia moschata TaxID=1265417 RepID=A0AAV8Z7P6_9CUCU|nr:hypothetical protein NQ318_022505 [Aromia moschata]